MRGAVLLSTSKALQALLLAFVLAVQPLTTVGISSVAALGSPVVMPTSHTINANIQGTASATSSVDATGFETLSVQFDYHAEALDNSDSFVYGYTTNGQSTELGSINGANENGSNPNKDTDEHGSVDTVLPASLDNTNLSLYFLNTGKIQNSDQITVTNITITGSVIVVDNEAPAQPVAKLAGGSYKNTQIVELTSSDNSGAKPTIYYTTDGSSPDSTSTLYTNAIAIETTTTLKAIAYDEAMNSSSVMSEEYVIESAEDEGDIDSTAPVAKITNPENRTTRSGEVITVRGEIDDNNPMNSYVRIEGPNGYVKTSLYTDGRTIHEYEWDTNGINEGEYTIYFETRDKAGNKDGSQSSPGASVDVVRIVIDDTKPSLQMLTPSGVSTVSGAMKVSGRASDNEAVTELELRGFAGLVCEGQAVVSENIFASYEETTTTFNYDFDTTQLADGDYCFKVTARDEAGNKRFKEVENVAIMNTSGQGGEVTQPPNPGSTNGGTANNSSNGKNNQPFVARSVLTPATIFASSVSPTLTQPGPFGYGTASTSTSTIPSSNGSGSSNSSSNKVAVNGEMPNNGQDEDNDGDVLAATNANDASNGFLGLAWYWWLGIVAIGGGGLWWLLGLLRNRGTAG